MSLATLHSIGTAWELEYETGCPTDRNGDSILEEMEYAYDSFETRALALDAARDAIREGKTFFGLARIRPFRVVSVAEIQADAADDDGGDLDWWKEDGRFYAYCGESEEVDE